MLRSGIKFSWLIWHLFGISIILHHLNSILLLYANTVDIYSAYILVSLQGLYELNDLYELSISSVQQL